MTDHDLLIRNRTFDPRVLCSVALSSAELELKGNFARNVSGADPL